MDSVFFFFLRKGELWDWERKVLVMDGWHWNGMEEADMIKGHYAFKILTKIHKLFRHVQWLPSLYFVENDRFNII